ncbi:type IX secretion system plug protein domain-containing protein [Chryseobacterium arthrosphaerae]|uniref:Type IX secretion system plug protein domain-containing protein n=1 Tax=Chryseobacterium arthrosphaerae TaxID=651561 RepID=A0ABU7R2C4_9FLAO|nr:type IX secretion system plug protein domain-containing protein [Chryseobacterium arthrosphaerae]
MKTLRILLLSLGGLVYGQNIQSIQLFNPQTNDETPVIKFGEQLVLSFDDLTNRSDIYRYTIKHYDRNWNDDNLFFTEFATGSMNALLDQFQYSFNTLQAYTHYKLTFPNDKIQPKISGNYELIVYKDSADKPLFKRRFYLVEDMATLGLNISRIADAKNPNLNQRVEVKASPKGGDISSNVNSMTLNVMQNNNPNMVIANQKASTVLGNQLLFQQMNLVFPGDNEFYYFDNKNMNMAADMVRATEIKDDVNQTYLHPVWAFPLNYQYQPDVNGAWYYRRNDLGRERNAEREADYSWVHFYLESDPVDKEIYVLGGFNNFTPSKENQMQYDAATKQYVARIFLKQGFYNYVLVTREGNGPLNFGEVNGNFWQTENLYQAFLYYAPFGRNYDGLMGYGEFRTPVSSKR